MSIEIKYTGTQQRWPELATTGKQSVWMPGQIEERDDVEAGKLLATGLFKTEPTPLTATTSAQGNGSAGSGIAKISAGDGAPPAAVLLNADGRARKRMLSVGHSINEQNMPNALFLTTRTHATNAHPAQSTVLSVISGATLTGGDKIAVRLHDGNYWITTVVSVATNDVTIADPTPAYIKADSGISKIGLDLPLSSSYGCASAAVALLGGPVDVIPGYGYGGATQLQMLPDFERQLRFYLPDYVWMHHYENDMADGAIAGGASVARLKERTRQMCRMAQAYGAVPIVVNSGPYYKPTGPVGVSGSRVADYDEIARWVIQDLPKEVPGTRGIDIAMAYTDPAFLTDNYGRRPLTGYTDGVHLNYSKRFFAGQICAPQVKDILPPADSLIEHTLSGRDLTLAAAGAGGTGVNLQVGSEVPQGWKVYTGAENGSANGTAVVTTSRNADGSLRVIATWPDAASNSLDTVALQYLLGATSVNWALSTVPPSWVGSNREFQLYARVKFREIVGIASAAPAVDFRPSYLTFDGTQSIDMLDTMPVGDEFVVLTTPQFKIAPGTVSITNKFVIKPKASGSPANARIVVDLYELGAIPAHPKMPASFV